MPCNRSSRLIKKLHAKRQKEPRKTFEDSLTRENGTAQRVAQLLDSCMMMMMMMMIFGQYKD
jgi:hypothetical protein